MDQTARNYKINSKTCCTAKQTTRKLHNHGDPRGGTPGARQGGGGYLAFTQSLWESMVDDLLIVYITTCQLPHKK